MTAYQRRQLALLAAFTSAAAGLAAFGCSLGLDPSLIPEGGAGSPATDGPGLESGGDAGAESSLPPAMDSTVPPDAAASVDAGACTTDNDCKSAAAAGGACVTAATCDPTWHVCMLDVCGNGASCQAEICQSSSLTCTLPATYAFAPTAFAVTYGGVGPAGSQDSIAAAWPFVVVITNNGVVAYNVSDPTNPAPPQVLVHGVPFIPTFEIAVGRRIYFVGGVQGAGPVFRQAVAWIDVPQNPFLTSLQATAAWVSTPDTSLVGAPTNGTDGLFLIYNDAPLEPTVNAHPPFADTTILTTYPNAGLPGGIVAASGSRLISYRYDGTAQVPNFAFIKSAGTMNEQTALPEQTPPASWGKLDDQWTFATGADGSVLWETAVLEEDDSGATSGVTSVRLAWLVDSASAGNFDATQYADLVTYSPPGSGGLVGWPAWVDANTALGFAAINGSPGTQVQIVKKGTPNATVVPGVGATKQLSVGPGSVGVATSNGFAYALLQDDPKNQTCRVQIFAPSCAGTD